MLLGNCWVYLWNMAVAWSPSFLEALEGGNIRMCGQDVRYSYDCIMLLVAQLSIL